MHHPEDRARAVSKADLARGDPQESSLQPAEGQELVEHRARWSLIRDVLVFQVKLVVDGLKDLVLAPLSVVAGVLDVLRPERRGEGRFYRLLRRGRAFDRWVGLFEAARREGDANSEEITRSPEGMDAQLRQLETMLVEQVENGNLTRKAREAVDSTLDAIRDRLDKSKGDSPDAQGKGS